MLSGQQTKLIAEIAEKIRGKILSGGFQAGERLKQERLAEEFGVSRTPIREALSRLEVQGLVSQQQRRSAVVCAPSSRDIAEIYRIRAELEGLAASLAARWISDAALVRLRATHDRFLAKIRDTAPAQKGRGGGRSARRMALLKLDAEFHNAVITASNNRNLERLIVDLRSGAVGAAMATAATALDASRLEGEARQHQIILEALERRDGEEARAAIAGHIMEAGEFILAHVENAEVG